MKNRNHTGAPHAVRLCQNKNPQGARPGARRPGSQRPQSPLRPQKTRAGTGR